MLRWLAAGVGAGALAQSASRKAEATHGGGGPANSDSLALHIGQLNGAAPDQVTDLVAAVVPPPTAAGAFRVRNNFTDVPDLGFSDAVQGFASGGNNGGVFGRNNTLDGVGVVGAAPSGTGVFGDSSAGSGVAGVTDTGSGVVGFSSGNFTQGLLGQGQGATTHGVTGISIGAFGLSGTSTSGNGFVGVNQNGNTFAGQFIGHGLVQGDNNAPGIFVKGSMVATGAKPAAVPTSQGLTLLYAVETPDVLFEDVGKARLVKGRTRVDLDPLFIETIETEEFWVFLTPRGDTRGLYVTSQDEKGFEIREQQGGQSDVEVDWRLMARRKGMDASRRLAPIENPIPAAIAALQPQFELLAKMQDDQKARGRSA